MCARVLAQYGVDPEPKYDREDAFLDQDDEDDGDDAAWKRSAAEEVRLLSAGSPPLPPVGP